ncbi:inter-alpha-trypsin inhibitor heavy chain H4-like [Diabrotica undecimpunctata]|uniref:inter-alpha-trypsin inhibitor heavy chain H4-like n=1 Tax=Diabrotica undecimpunctata TaxID=50387 RepID=UPI003B63C7BA
MSMLQKSNFCVVVCLILFTGQAYAFEYVVFKTAPVFKPSIVKRDTKSDLPEIKEFLVNTHVSNHFAETSVTNVVENPDHFAKQTTFSVVLPERAFISGFYMEIDGKQYKAFVKEKDLARTIFNKAAEIGQTAGHVAVSTKNSNRFTITVNIEPRSKVLFKLEYEELLQRENGQYKIITNIQPGQIVKKLKVTVTIKENQPLINLKTPYLQAGSGSMDLGQMTIDPNARVSIDNSSAVIIFEPNVERQMEFACSGLGNTEYNGFAGQFIVNYDVNRTNEGGDVFYQDNFFFISFAPQALDPIPKHMVFILDTSGSMKGFKITQLKDAMSQILPQLNENDIFTIIQFELYVYDWNINKNKNGVFNNLDIDYMPIPYGHLAENFKSYTPSIIEASKENIETMKSVIDNLNAVGGTNVLAALEVGLMAVSSAQKKFPNKYLPIIVCLSDGKPDTRSNVADNITYIDEVITKLNQASYKTPIYSLSFGDVPIQYRNFLISLSGHNFGEEHKVFVDLDSSQYIQKFYETISVPLLSNVAVNNLPPSAQITKINFPIFFNGSELVIAGKGVENNKTSSVTVSANSKKGLKNFEPQVGVPLARLERIWAYLTVKQLADQYYTTRNSTLAKIGLEIAMNHSLVTDFTSLVVVKSGTPNETVDIEDAYSGIFPKKPSELPMCKNITRICSLPQDSRNCGSFTVNWFYSTLKHQCEQFQYGGCGGTDNRFESKQACDETCVNPTGSERCKLPISLGTCNKGLRQWFYDHPKHTCVQYVYGGCLGNSNRFNSRAECLKLCNPNMLNDTTNVRPTIKKKCIKVTSTKLRTYNICLS